MPEWDGSAKEDEMLTRLVFAALLLAPGMALAQAQKLNDAEIAHIAYTAGVLDIAAAKLALSKSSNADVKDFANQMVRDHQAVNDKALALVKRLNVTPEDNATSQSLTKAAEANRVKLDKLSGAAFDRAYVSNEVAYHKTVNGALKDTLIPNSQNAELKSLLQTGLTLFTAHQEHAEHLAKTLAK
jgi:putative membrane protein